jgi:hypothetical protein
MCSLFCLIVVVSFPQLAFCQDDDASKAFWEGVGKQVTSEVTAALIDQSGSKPKSTPLEYPSADTLDKLSSDATDPQLKALIEATKQTIIYKQREATESSTRQATLERVSDRYDAIYNISVHSCPDSFKVAWETWLDALDAEVKLVRHINRTYGPLETTSEDDMNEFFDDDKRVIKLFQECMYTAADQWKQQGTQLSKSDMAIFMQFVDLLKKSSADNSK